MKGSNFVDGESHTVPRHYLLLSGVPAAESSALPFLVVRGAGHAPVNGRYAHVGVHNGKPKYKKVDGESIIYYWLDRWMLHHEDSTFGWLYETMEGNSELPPFQWQTLHDARIAPPAPNLSFGSFEDLQVGDEVTFVHSSLDFDWTGCSSDRRLIFGPGYPVIIHRIDGAWFFPTNFPDMAAPLAALGSVKLRGTEHPIAGAESSASSAAPSGTRSSLGASGLSK